MPDRDDQSTDDPALGLVHQGWAHLQRQRPVAAWACWRRALRIEPEHKAAKHALRVLANAGDLPEAAKVDRKFLTPADEASRAAWDRALRGRDLEDLDQAADAFAGLDDGRARYNQGLCLAWLGRNADAVAALDRATQILAEAESEIETAVAAWSLAEVLRQGAGAEPLADDLNHVVTFAWLVEEGGRDDVRAIPSPIDPVTGEARLAEARLYEWLDPGSSPIRKLRATVVALPRSLRLSGTDPVLLLEAHDEALRAAGRSVASSRREVTPLPLAFLDAAVWAIRLPPGVDPEEADRLNRQAVERYYEDVWILRPRLGLDGRSPLQAAEAATRGDRVALAKLSAVVLVREQLGARPTTVRLYQGYPFDRLRRRLGLAATDPDAIDPADPTCMGAADLDRLDPATLDDFALVDAYESAAALGDDRRTERFALILADGEPSRLARLDVKALFATLVRSALARDDVEGALGRVDRAIEVDARLDSGRARRDYLTWKAEVQARAGRPDAATLAYRALIDEAPAPDPAFALDAAEFLLDNGHDAHARELARLAADLAEAAGDDDLAARAEVLL